MSGAKPPGLRLANTLGVTSPKTRSSTVITIPPTPSSTASFTPLRRATVRSARVKMLVTVVLAIRLPSRSVPSKRPGSESRPSTRRAALGWLFFSSSRRPGVREKSAVSEPENSAAQISRTTMAKKYQSMD